MAVVGDDNGPFGRRRCRMSNPSDPRPSRKSPAEPYPEFPLTPHAPDAGQKKIHGRNYYFGKWARRVDGKLVRVAGDGLMVAGAVRDRQRDPGAGGSPAADATGSRGRA